MKNKIYNNIEEFYTLCFNYRSAKEMADKEGIGIQTVYRNLQKLENVNLNKREEIRKYWSQFIERPNYKPNYKRTMYDFNDYAFHHFTPDSVYWLGMIASDGCVYKNRNKISINAKYEDKEHIEAFANFLNYTGKVKERLADCKGKKFPSVYLELNSKIMKNRLIELGIQSQKSNKDIDYLKYIPEGFKIFFIFGYLDGDGSIILTEDRKAGWVSIIGNFSLLMSVQDYLNRNFLIESNIKKDEKYSNDKYVLTITQLYSVYLFCSLYLNFYSDIQLKRKRERCSLLFKSIQEKQSFNNGTLKYRNSNFINLNKINQKDKIKNNKCPHCGKPIREEAKTCEDCWHKLQRKVERPFREVLKEDVRTTPFLKLSEKYGVSNTAIKKWCKSYGLPYKKSEIKLISDEGWIKL